MNTAIIYVFSGTDNTLITAKMVSSALQKHTINTTIYSIKYPFTDVPSPNDFDLVGFAYPVHAFNIPKLFLDFVKKLPDADKKAFIFKTSGEPLYLNQASSRRLRKVLKAKGFDVTIDRHLLMPYNIVFRYKDELAKQMHLYNQKLTNILAEDLLARKKDEIKVKLRHKVLSFLFRVQQPAAVFNGRLYRANKKRCNMCLKCVRGCPAGNISLKDNKIKFDGKCTMCMRCVMFCPQSAVNPGLLKFFKVNGAYDFEKLLSDKSIKGDYVNKNTKGYFKLFRNYFKKADETIYKNSVRNSDIDFDGEYIKTDELKDNITDNISL